MTLILSTQSLLAQEFNPESISCTKGDLSLVYINGVLNSEDQSSKTLDKIENLILVKEFRRGLHHSGKVQFSNVWNQSKVLTEGKKAALTDLVEAAKQVIGPKFPLYHKYALSFAKDMQVRDKSIDRSIYEMYLEFNSSVATQGEVDYDTLLKRVREEGIDEGHKVLLISHSQGNLFADQVMDSYVRQPCEDEKCSNKSFYRNLQLASPRGYHSSNYHDGLMFEQDVLVLLGWLGVSNGAATHKLIFNNSKKGYLYHRGLAYSDPELRPYNVLIKEAYAYFGYRGNAHGVDNYIGITGDSGKDLETGEVKPMKEIFIDKVKKLVKTYPSNCDETTYDVQSHQIDESIPGYNYKFTFKVNIDGDGNFLKTIDGINFIPEDTGGDIGLASFNTTEKKEYGVVLANYFVKQRIEENSIYLDIYLNRAEYSKDINFSLPVKDAFDALSEVGYSGKANGCYEGYIEYSDEFGEYCKQCNTRLDSEGDCIRNVENIKIKNDIYVNAICGGPGGAFSNWLRCYYEYSCEGKSEVKTGSILSSYASCRYEDNSWKWFFSDTEPVDAEVTCDNKTYTKFSCIPIKPTKVYSE